MPHDKNSAMNLSLENSPKTSSGPPSASASGASPALEEGSRHSPINEIADDRALGGGVGWLPTHDDVITVCVVALQVHGRARSPSDQWVSICSGGRGEEAHGWDVGKPVAHFFKLRLASPQFESTRPAPHISMT